MAGEIKKGAALSYAAVAFNAVAGLVYTPWMVSSIGVDDYGLYTLAISIVNFFMMDFGLGDSVTRFMSRFHAEGGEDRVPGFLGVVYRLSVLIAAGMAVVFLVVYLNIDSIYANLGEGGVRKFKVLFAVAASYSVLAFPSLPFRGILVSNERFVALNGANLFQRVLTVALVVACLLAGWGVYALVAVNAFAALAFACVRYALVRRLTGDRADVRHWDGREAAEVLGFSGWSMLVQLFQRAIFTVAPSVLAVLSDTWEVTLFGLASSLEGYVWTLASALNGMFAPRVARIGASDRESLQNLMEGVGRAQLLVIGFVEVSLCALGGRFVECWMGGGYGALYPCALLVILPSLIQVPQLIGDTALVFRDGGVRWKALAYGAMAAANVVGLLALSGPFGALGACASICLAYFLRTALMDVAYARRLGVRLGRFFRAVYARWLLPAAASAALGLALSELAGGAGWGTLVALEAAVAACYAVLCWRFYLSDEEKRGRLCGVFK